MRYSLRSIEAVCDFESILTLSYSSDTTLSPSKTDAVELHATNDGPEGEKLSGIERDLGSEKELIKGSLEYTETPDPPKPTNTPANDAPQYVTGAKLVSIIISICLAAFLMLLDTSIVSTVFYTLIHNIPFASTFAN